jgi:hypothetical protein
MRPTVFNRLSMKPIKRDSLVKTLAEVVMTLMFMFTLELEPISVVKNQLLLKA